MENFTLRALLSAVAFVAFTLTSAPLSGMQRAPETGAQIASAESFTKFQTKKRARFVWRGSRRETTPSTSAANASSGLFVIMILLMLMALALPFSIRSALLLLAFIAWVLSLMMAGVAMSLAKTPEEKKRAARAMAGALLSILFTALLGLLVLAVAGGA